MALCPMYLFFQQTDFLSVLHDVLGELATLNTPANLVVVREGLKFNPIYLTHAQVSNEFLACRLHNWIAPGMKVLLRQGQKMENHIELKNKQINKNQQSTSCWFTKSL